MFGNGLERDKHDKYINNGKFLLSFDFIIHEGVLYLVFFSSLDVCVSNINDDTLFLESTSICWGWRNIITQSVTS